MSYDISLRLSIDTGGPEPHDLELVDVGNYTSNVARMWSDALGHRLADFHDRTGGDCLDALNAAVDKLTADPARYRAMEPSNGWGDYDGALAYLTRLRDACAAHPKATIHIWA